MNYAENGAGRKENRLERKSNCCTLKWKHISPLHHCRGRLPKPGSHRHVLLHFPYLGWVWRSWNHESTELLVTSSAISLDKRFGKAHDFQERLQIKSLLGDLTGWLVCLALNPPIKLHTHTLAVKTRRVTRSRLRSPNTPQMLTSTCPSAAPFTLMGLILCIYFGYTWQCSVLKDHSWQCSEDSARDQARIKPCTRHEP